MPFFRHFPFLSPISRCTSGALKIGFSYHVLDVICMCTTGNRRAEKAETRDPWEIFLATASRDHACRRPVCEWSSPSRGPCFRSPDIDLYVLDELTSVQGSCVIGATSECDGQQPIRDGKVLTLRILCWVGDSCGICAWSFRVR